jgi:hypothetical protein
MSTAPNPGAAARTAKAQYRPRAAVWNPNLLMDQPPAERPVRRTRC